MKKRAREVRKKIIEMAAGTGAYHLGSSLSCVDLLVFLTSKKNLDPGDAFRDRLILSKGHAASALYAAFCKSNLCLEEDLKEFYCNGGRLAGHPTYGSLKAVEATTGSLGHGLPIGVGMALAGKGKFSVFVLMSDGECNEGSVWEAALFASRHKLDNLVGVIDCNNLQAFGTTEEVLGLEPLKDKWKSFGWEVLTIDGHDFEQISRAFSKTPFKKGRPSMIIAKTVKGKGVLFMENKLEWHYNLLDEKLKKKALEQLEKEK
ncbi:MAG: transketolase [Candidatus Micrarchaeia archaeon]